MLTRLYIDNYKCFSNFELKLGPLQLLLGDNGTGKSSVLDVVAGLQMAVTSGKQDLDECFSPRTLTRWDTRTQQTFELDVEDKDHKGQIRPIRYRLQLEHFIESVTVAHESLSFDGNLVYKNDGGRAEVFVGKAWKEVLVDPFTSALAKLPVHEVRGVAGFRGFMERVLVLRPRPSSMSASSTSEDDRLAIDGSNFSAWYRALDPQQPFPAKQALHESLAQALSGFESLVFSKTGENERVLKTTWKADEGNSPRFELGFDELSDGQRMLIVLYTLLSLPTGDAPRMILLDEPTNYVSLAEIEPWLHEVEERTEARTIQAMVASHHPELINAWASTSGIRFSHRSAGPVRVERFTTHDDDPLTPAERIARGWDDEDA